MVGFVIWIVGLVLTIKAALEIWRIHAPIERRLIAIISDLHRLIAACVCRLIFRNIYIFKS